MPSSESPRAGEIGAVFLLTPCAAGLSNEGDDAEVAELADALGSGPSGLKTPVQVQVLSSVVLTARLPINERIR